MDELEFTEAESMAEEIISQYFPWLNHHFLAYMHNIQMNSIESDIYLDSISSLSYGGSCCPLA